MAEVLIAIFVVAVGVLGTVASLWYGIRSERYSERRTNAVSQARELMNVIRANNWAFNPAVLATLNDGDYDNDGDDWASTRPFNAAPLANYFPNNPFNFQRRVEIKRLSTDPNNYLNTMAAIKVSVVWEEGPARKRIDLWAYHRQP